MAEVNQRRPRKRIAKRISARRRRKARILLGLACVGVFLIIAIFNINLYRYIKKFPENKICKNIYIDDVEVSNMTKKEAKSALKNSLIKDQEILITMNVAGKSVQATLGELGLQFKNVDKSVNEALKYGKEGSLLGKYRQIKKLEKERKIFPKEHVIDSKKTKDVLKERGDSFLTHALDATVTKSGKKFKITKEKSGEMIDSKKAVKLITKHLNSDWKHTVFTVEVPIKEEKPKVTEEQLKTVKDELGTYSTDAGGGTRWQNLKVAVEKLNGIVIVPDEEISIQDALSPFNAEAGYVEAGSYESGQVVDSFGGGVCQVTTTLYNAVLYAELQITERHPHSMLVDYVDPSRDAAIATGLLEFNFVNNYDTPILIMAEIDDKNQLRFSIYGKDTRAEGRTVEYESETLATEDYGVKYQEDPSSPLGSMVYEGAPFSGVSAQLWKIVKQDGVEQSREVINHSTYQKVDQIIKIGTKSSSYSATAMVQTAIASQKSNAIQEAIVNAQELPQ